MSIGFSETFTLNISVLSALLRHVGAGGDTGINGSMAALGIGSRKLVGITAWAEMAGLYVRRSHLLTELGQLICLRDPHLRKLGSKWVVYYQISRNPEATIWHALAGGFFRHGLCFSHEEAAQAAVNAIGKDSRKIRSDVSTSIRSIADPECLGDIQLIAAESREYRVIRRTLPNRLVLAYAIYDWRMREQRSQTVAFGDIAYRSPGPGRLFMMSEEELRSTARILESDGLLDVCRAAELDGLAFTFPGSPLDLLERYYCSDEE